MKLLSRWSEAESGLRLSYRVPVILTGESPPTAGDLTTVFTTHWHPLHHLTRPSPHLSSLSQGQHRLLSLATELPRCYHLRHSHTSGSPQPHHTVTSGFTTSPSPPVTGITQPCQPPVRPSPAAPPPVVLLCSIFKEYCCRYQHQNIHEVSSPDSSVSQRLHQ